jgi:hypothetical protein
VGSCVRVHQRVEGYTGSVARVGRDRKSKTVAYVDATGRATDDPLQAVSGEIAEYDGHGRPRGRTRFFLDRSELPWLPVSEPAFLLWVLVGLSLVWVGIGLLLTLT